MLYYDGRIGHQRPEFVRLEPGIALEVIEERLFVSVIIRI